MNWLKKNKLIIVFLVVIVSGYSTYRYIYKSHPSIEKTKADFIGSYADFFNEVSKSFMEWEGKTVELFGEVSSIDEQGIMLGTSIYCQFENTDEISTIELSKKITLKGRVVGYDDLLEELKLDKCIIIK